MADRRMLRHEILRLNLVFMSLTVHVYKNSYAEGRRIHLGDFPHKHPEGSLKTCMTPETANEYAPRNLIAKMRAEASSRLYRSRLQ